MTTVTITSPQQDAGEIFARDVAEHEMTILHDDGLYRHLRFAKPNTGINHFDIVTWPGHLSLGGDRDGYVFRRLEDMFQFFRSWSGTINPQYWAEKLTTRVKVKVYDEALCKNLVAEYIADAAEDDYYPGLKAYAQRELKDAAFDGLLETEESAREWLSNFKYVVPNVAPVRSYEFSDAWEWDLTDWDFHYLYACHAIQWGIEQYDRRPRSIESADVL